MERYIAAVTLNGMGYTYLYDTEVKPTPTRIANAIKRVLKLNGHPGKDAQVIAIIKAGAKDIAFSNFGFQLTDPVK